MDGYIGAAFGLAAGALFVLLGAPLARSAVAPNQWYGYRTRTTLTNADAWYAVNSQSGRHMVTTGAILFGCGLVGLAALNDPRQQLMLMLICIVVIALGLGYALISGHQTARQFTNYDDSRPDVSQ